MPTPDQIRIAHDQAQPRLMELWWALRPLTSVVRFMQTGAHPDDEISGMLAALAFRDGINLSYACSTRGEGGQNDIGAESGVDLGALRTKEMERACDRLSMRMYWFSPDPGDPIVDFGFSKSGRDTLQRWGRDLTIFRFAEILRKEQPDIICPTFLDVPGQHGHHRAMTEAASAAIAAAADPDLPSNLPLWRVKKMYLPAWSGAGQAYDDDLPPPPATLTIPGHDRETMTGWNWDRIGQQSRAFHRTQGMGRWTPAGAARDWPLHLAQSDFTGDDNAVWDHLPRNVADLAKTPGAEPIADMLREASTAIDAAVAAFPIFDAVAEAATRALERIQSALSACPAPVFVSLGDRLEAKVDQLGRVLRLALGVEAHAWTDTPFVAIGSETSITTECDAGRADKVRMTIETPKGWRVSKTTLAIDEDAAPHAPYPLRYDPAAPPRPRIAIQGRTGGNTAFNAYLPFDAPPVALPAARATLAPGAAVMNLATQTRRLHVAITDVAPKKATVTLDAPSGWTSERTASGFTVTAPQDVAQGHYRLGLRVNGQPAATTRTIAYDHIAPTAISQTAELRIRVLDVQVATGQIGYIGGGNDRVGHWLRAMGVDVVDLSDADLSDPSVFENLAGLVIGIFAMRFRPGLAEAMPDIHRWIHAGGTLVTLYHRPWDNWRPDHTPPRRLEIGQPSLRWRVTDEKAPVTHLQEHPILTFPNKIDAPDWDGWVKERGLYFAKSWDPAYAPLIQLADPDEAPHTGALLVADIGRGRHVHTSLILHHQMENLVPGAFRLMANFIAPRA